MTQTTSARTASKAAADRAVRATARRETHGPWQLLGPLGGGPLTEVLAVRPVDAGDEVLPAYALKRPRPDGNEAEALRCLQREAVVASRVSHPRLISILSAHVHEPPYYVVMPKLAGRTLADWIAAGWLSVATALCMARQVVEALAALHADGWMHADVKPGNVFVAPQGHATLLDLGFARRREDSQALLARPLLGTAAYLAPEAFTSARAPDMRSDFYSLGVMLFEMLSGRRPFEGVELPELAKQHLTARPPKLRRIVSRLPGEVATLVNDLLAKEPMRRPQSPGELIDRLVALEILTFEDREPLRP